MQDTISFNHRTIRKGMSSWLKTFPWDMWGTYTFKHPFSPEAAKRAFQRHHKRMQNQFNQPIPVFWVMEPNSVSDHVHLHSLLGCVSDVPNSAKRMFNDWKSHLGHGAAYFEPYEKDGGVDRYLTKYIIKDRYHRADWDMWNIDSFPALND